MALLAIVLIAAVTPPKQQLNDAVASQSEQSIQSKNGDKTAPSHVSDREWHVWGDSWAQWLMAIFSVAATFVSLKAIFLVRDTLNAAREGNDLVRADRRPWLAIKITEAHEDFLVREEFAAFLEYSIENMGRFPAINGSIRFEVMPIRRRHDHAAHFRIFVDESIAAYDPDKIDVPITVFPERSYGPPTPELVDCAAPAEFRRLPMSFQLNVCVCYQSPDKVGTLHTAEAFFLYRTPEYSAFLNSDQDTRYLTTEMVMAKIRPTRLNSIS